MSEQETPRKHLDVRKYPNRRYYDATHSRHMTLEELRSLIRDGYDITVTDRHGAKVAVFRGRSVRVKGDVIAGLQAHIASG